MASSKCIANNGYAAPLGASRMAEGTNFALFSQHAQAVVLRLFYPDEQNPFLEIKLDPKANKTGWIWHVFMCNLPDDIEYSYRIEGPKNPSKGLLFDSTHDLLDPYARGVNTSHTWGERKEDQKPLRGKVIHSMPFDWGKDLSPQIPMQDLIIYEMHTRAFTIDSSSKVKHPGTFKGIIEKIPYLKSLGINAIELLPVFEFNECDNLLKNPHTGEPLQNFWGYSTINFFSPMSRFGSTVNSYTAIDEFKMLVKEMHKNGIEVILDVVYNHTGEGDENGPHLSFRGIDNSIYYILGPEGHYMNFSGCGNTFNCNHPVITKLIMDSLRYWVSEMHVDGFRFDLASILTRDKNGTPLKDPPLIETICNDPILANTKLIAEAWDAAGLYQVGSFPGGSRWSEWNGKYRDTVRRFIKGTENQTGLFAHALSGSDDLYEQNKQPYNSINFITAHDGFTLTDLVTYQEKHNEENGEENRDGDNHNESWNCGIEGPSKNHKIEQLRDRQKRNFLTALFLSQGTPMLLMGDEYGHTRNGNNNAWCQDNHLNWFLWNELEKNKNFFRFCSQLIHFRKNHSLLKRTEFLKNEDITWHGAEPFSPNWEPSSRFLAFTLKDHQNGHDLYIAFNSHFESLTIHLPPSPQFKKWYRIIDTSLESPEDFLENPQIHGAIKYTHQMKDHSAFMAIAL